MVTMQEVNDYFTHVRATFAQFCSRFNPGTAEDKRSWEHRTGTITSALFRGPVFEKASCIYCDLTVDTPPVLARQTGYDAPHMPCLVLEIGIHPYNPQVPKGYIELRAHSTGNVVLAGGTDIFPYRDSTDEVALFAGRMRALCRQHAQDYDQLRRVRVDFFQSKLRGTPVGSHAGIYSFGLEGDAMAFVSSMAETFFTAYGDIVERCAGLPYTPEDKQHQHILHGLWAEWIMAEDEGTRFGLAQGIPPEALLGAILPPVAVF